MENLKQPARERQNMSESFIFELQQRCEKLLDGSTPATHDQGRGDRDPSLPATRPADSSLALPPEPSSNGHGWYLNKAKKKWSCCSCTACSETWGFSFQQNAQFNEGRAPTPPETPPAPNYPPPPTTEPWNAFPPPAPTLALPPEPSSNSAKRRARRNARARLEGTPHAIQDTPPPQPPAPPPLEDEGGRKEYRICMVHRRRRLIQHCVGYGTPLQQYSCKPEFPCIPTSAMVAPHWQTQRHPLRTRERQTSAPPATTRRTRSTTRVNPEGNGASPATTQLDCAWS